MTGKRARQAPSRAARTTRTASPAPNSSGPRAGQVVLTGGGAELAGLAEFAQSALGMPVRIGRAPALTGLPEAHATPGFATLAGLCLYAADDPIDIRAVGSRYRETRSAGGMPGSFALGRLFRALKEYF